MRRSSNRFVEIWLEQGYRALLEAVTHEDPDWLAVQIEASRRVRTDEQFREQVARLEEDTKAKRESRFARLRDTSRDDVPIEVLAQFLGMLANGVAFARLTDDPMPDLDHLMTLIETGVAPRCAASDAETERAAKDRPLRRDLDPHAAAAGNEEVAGKLRAAIPRLTRPHGPARLETHTRRPVGERHSPAPVVPDPVVAERGVGPRA